MSLLLEARVIEVDYENESERLYVDSLFIYTNYIEGDPTIMNMLILPKSINYAKGTFSTIFTYKLHAFLIRYAISFTTNSKYHVKSLSSLKFLFSIIPSCFNIHVFLFKNKRSIKCIIFLKTFKNHEWFTLSIISFYAKDSILFKKFKSF